MQEYNKGLVVDDHRPLFFDQDLQDLRDFLDRICRTEIGLTDLPITDYHTAGLLLLTYYQISPIMPAHSNSVDLIPALRG